MDRTPTKTSYLGLRRKRHPRQKETLPPKTRPSLNSKVRRHSPTPVLDTSPEDEESHLRLGSLVGPVLSRVSGLRGSQLRGVSSSGDYCERSCIGDRRSGGGSHDGV